MSAMRTPPGARRALHGGKMSRNEMNETSMTMISARIPPIRSSVKFLALVFSSDRTRSSVRRRSCSCARPTSTAITRPAPR